MSMNQEYRRELKDLARAEKKLWQDLEKHHKDLRRVIAKALNEQRRSKARTAREIDRIDRRRAILEGRLG